MKTPWQVTMIGGTFAGVLALISIQLRTRTPMHRQSLVFMLLLLVASWTWAADAASWTARWTADSVRPMTRKTNRVRQLLIEGKFAEIEALEKRSRDLSVTIEDGQPLRAAVFDAFACLCGASSEELKAYLKTITPRIKEWRAAFPESSAARIAEAGIPHQQAWALRGDGYASSVPESVWPVFREKNAESAKLLDGLPETTKSGDAWYAARLEVARDLSMDEARKLLKEALDKHPRYMPLYFTGADFYSPRWGGSREELKAFIEDAAARTKDWAGDMMYARLQWSNQGRDMFRNGQAKWPRMKQGFEKIVAEYPSSWNLNQFAKFACMAGDRDTTLQTIKKLKGAVLVEGWDSMQFYAACKQWATRGES